MGDGVGRVLVEGHEAADRNVLPGAPAPVTPPPSESDPVAESISDPVFAAPPAEPEELDDLALPTRSYRSTVILTGLLAIAGILLAWQYLR